jgi:hypothetical protein
VLAHDYLDPDPDMGLLDVPSGRKKWLRLDGRKKLLIPKTSLPTDWEMDGIMLAVAVPYPKGSAAGGLACAFNGESFILQPGYHELPLRLPAHTVGCFFNLEPSGNGAMELELSWWPYRQRDLILQEDGESQAGKALLPKLGVARITAFDGARPFVIGKQELPTDWTPKILKVGVSSVQEGGTTRVLNGHLEFNGTRHPLEGYYTEIPLSGYASDADIGFTLYSKEPAKVKLVWWGE